MTENQSKYLADLANQKGIVLEDTENVSPAWASAKIEELKALPDVQYDEISDDVLKQINKEIVNTIKDLSLWTFTE